MSSRTLSDFPAKPITVFHQFYNFGGGMFERKCLSPLFLCVFTAVLCQEAWTVRTVLQTFAGSVVPYISTHKEHHSF